MNVRDIDTSIFERKLAGNCSVIPKPGYMVQSIRYHHQEWYLEQNSISCQEAHFDSMHEPLMGSVLPESLGYRDSHHILSSLPSWLVRVGSVTTLNITQRNSSSSTLMHLRCSLRFHRQEESEMLFDSNLHFWCEVLVPSVKRVSLPQKYILWFIQFHERKWKPAWNDRRRPTQVKEGDPNHVFFGETRMHYDDSPSALRILNRESSQRTQLNKFHGIRDSVMKVRFVMKTTGKHKGNYWWQQIDQHDWKRDDWKDSVVEYVLSQQKWSGKQCIVRLHLQYDALVLEMKATLGSLGQLLFGKLHTGNLIHTQRVQERQHREKEVKEEKSTGKNYAKMFFPVFFASGIQIERCLKGRLTQREPMTSILSKHLCSHSKLMTTRNRSPLCSLWKAIKDRDDKRLKFQGNWTSLTILVRQGMRRDLTRGNDGHISTDQLERRYLY